VRRFAEWCELRDIDGLAQVEPIHIAAYLKALQGEAVHASEAEEPLLVGLRDRALIGVMAYTFARISAVLSMRVEDYYIQGRQGWVRLHEKGGKEITMPCHHNLDRYLEEYVAAAAIAGDARGRSFAPCAAARGWS
jgi:site-specific recombinase XerD